MPPEQDFQQIEGMLTSHGIVGLVALSLIIIGIFHVMGFRVVVTTALRAGRV